MARTQPTIKQAKGCHPLAPAVLRQLGGGADAVTSAIEAGNHGADAGWSGFTYYTDTSRFAKAHRGAIAKLAAETAADFGQGLIEMVKRFVCLKGLEDADEAVSLALFGGKPRNKDIADEVLLVENALAWFALEEVGRAIANLDPED